MGRLSYTTHDKSPDAGDVRTDVTPQARPFSTFKQAVPLDIPDAPRTNTLMDLGNAMSRLNPALTGMFGQIEDTRTEAEKAAAIEKSRQAQDQNITDLKEAQRQGYLPDGSAPNYIRAFKGNFLKLGAERGSKLMQEAYFSNDELRNSDDPQAFEKFAREWKSKYDETNNVVAGYTPLEIHDSKYHETLSSSLTQLHGTHIHHRVGEREKAAVETAGNLIQTRLDEAFDGAVDAPDLTKVAASINDVFANQTTGMLAYGGMRGSKANEILTESIITKAVSAGDASILDVAEHVTGTNGGSLAKTKVFRDKAETARQHIAQSNWLSQEHSRTLAQHRGDGTETLEQVEARARQDRARIESEYETTKAHREQFTENRTKAKEAEPELSAIAKLHSLNGDYSSVEIQQHLKKLAQIDPDAYRSAVTWLQSSGKHANETGNLQVFTALRAEISNSPDTFQTSKIIQAAAKNQLTAGQVSSLFSESESQQRAFKDHPALNAPLMRDLRADLKAAVQKDETGEYGEARLKSDKAAYDLNRLAMAYMKSHPKSGEFELYEAMQKHIDTIARKYSPDLDSTMKGQERQAEEKKSKQVEQEQMQTRVEAEVKELRSQPQGERAKLDAELLKRGYKNRAQRESIINDMLKGKK